MMNRHDILASETIEQQLEFANLPQGWSAIGSIVLLTLLVYAVITMYQREHRMGASRRMRILLSAIRCTVLLLLAGIWLQPIVATYIHRQMESYTLVLVDHSASMALRDHYPDPDDRKRLAAQLDQGDAADLTEMRRIDIANGLLRRDRGRFLKQLAERNAVRVYGFGDRLLPMEAFRDETGETTDRAVTTTQSFMTTQPATSQNDPQSAPPSANAPATDITRSLRQAVEANAAHPVAAVVVLSDGQFNRGEPVEVAGRYAHNRGIPIYAIGVGDPSPPRNIAVTAIEAPPNVFAKDPFKITAHLRSQRLEGTSVAVELAEQTTDASPPVVVARQQITVGPGDQISPVVFEHRIGHASQSRLLVRVEPQPFESLLDDNTGETSVRALDNKTRVLLIAGGPSWEYRYLSRLLERDAAVDVSCWLQSADQEAVRDGNTVITELPREAETLAAYDCIILLDPNPADFDTQWARRIEQVVSHAGAGLLYAAGRKNTPRFVHDAETQALIDLLPVVFDASEADLLINEQGHFQNSSWPLLLPTATMSHPVLAMSDQPGESIQIWSRLPGVYWHYPVRREKPVATVLLRHSNPQMRNSFGEHVLLASQFVGAGRTGFLGYDHTWRWRVAGPRYFNRFWIQLLRHLMEGKLLAGQRRGLIQFGHGSGTVGEAVMIEARLLDRHNQPLEQDEISAWVLVDHQRVDSLKLRLQPGRPGWYRSQYVPTMQGIHTFRIELPGQDTNASDSGVTADLRVGRPALEYRQTHLSPSAMNTLANLSAGGTYINLEEMDDLPSLIPSKTTSLILTGPPSSLWDRGWVLALLVGLLGLEWAGRKKARML